MTQHFRSHWNPTIHDATKNAHRFLPTPVPVVAEKKEVEKVVEQARERQNSPPPEAREPGALCILDRYNDYRAYIAADGAAYNNMGDLLGYIDGNQAGAPDMSYLGCLNADYQIENGADDVIASLNAGTASVHDSEGSSVATMTNAGEIKGENGTYLGQIEGFTFHEQSKMALYLVLLDPGMLSCIEEQ